MWGPILWAKYRYKAQKKKKTEKLRLIGGFLSTVMLWHIRVWAQIKFITLIYVAVGLKDTHCFEWCFLQKFLSRKIVKQFVFLVQSIVFLAVFLNLEKYIAFISF